MIGMLCVLAVATCWGLFRWVMGLDRPIFD